jgi:hypothetical protein
MVDGAIVPAAMPGEPTPESIGARRISSGDLGALSRRFETLRAQKRD